MGTGLLNEGVGVLASDVQTLDVREDRTGADVAARDDDGFDEASLVNASIEGKLDAFADLYTRYYPRVRGFCLRKTGDPELAHDIAHEAFTRAFQRIDGFGGPKRFGGWVGTIAANLVTDHFRRKSTSDISLEQVTDGERLPSYEVDPLAGVQREAVRAVVRPALDKLNPRQREALLLYELENKSCAEIGERLGISSVAAESLIARGRRRLRAEILAKAGPRDLFGIGAVALLRPISGTWRRFRDAVARKAPWIPTASRTVDEFGTTVLPASQAVKVIAVVVGTALALNAAGGAAAPNDAESGHRRPAVATTAEERPRIEVSPGDGTGGGPDGAQTAPVDANADVAVDPSSKRAGGKLGGRVDAPDAPGGHSGLNYSVEVDAGPTDPRERTTPHDASMNADVSLRDDDGDKTAGTGEVGFDSGEAGP